jgi:hypothetical protein
MLIYHGSRIKREMLGEERNVTVPESTQAHGENNARKWQHSALKSPDKRCELAGIYGAAGTISTPYQREKRHLDMIEQCLFKLSEKPVAVFNRVRSPVLQFAYQLSLIRKPGSRDPENSKITSLEAFLHGDEFRKDIRSA